MTNDRKYRGRIGTTAVGEAAYVKIEITTGAKVVETIAHGTAEMVTRVSIVGHSFKRRSRRKDYDGEYAGQCSDMPAAVMVPAPGLTIDDLARLTEIWKRWHMNDMRPGCAHQGEPVYEETRFGREPSSTLTPRCPETGYRWGHAWLYEEPPADVLADLDRIGAELDGTDGLRE